jgi:hypothetical protein
VKRTIIELCPRSGEQGYHACFKKRPTLWAGGKSVEEAVVELIRIGHDEIGITAKEFTNEVDANGTDGRPPSLVVLRKLIQLYSSHGNEFGFKLLLTISR